MIHFTEAEIDNFISEDIPYFDLTTELLDIKGQKSSITYLAREDIVVCGTEEVARIFARFNITLVSIVSSGTFIKKGETLIAGEGVSENIHLAWKVGVNILEYTCGISTRTKKMCDSAKLANSKISIGVTRKIFPGTKKLSIKGIVAGGAIPHRLGLSETILIFEEHIKFLGGIKGVAAKLKEIKHHTAEKKIEIEVHNKADALQCANIGVDVLQVDKMSCEELSELAIAVKEKNPNILVAAAGGVTMDNAYDYAKTGVDILITSAVYFGKPADIKADIQVKKGM